jgi:hypothetical protein
VVHYGIPDRLFQQLLSGDVEFNHVGEKGGILYHVLANEKGERGDCLPAGLIFEIFMFSQSGHGMSPKYLQYEEAFSKAIEKGIDREALNKERCYASLLFSKVCAELPNEFKHRLKIYVVVGSALDRWHSIDMVFILGNHYVAVDTTIDAFNVHGRKIDKPYILKFTNYQLRSPFLETFTKNVAQKLIHGCHELPSKAYGSVKRQKMVQA